MDLKHVSILNWKDAEKQSVKVAAAFLDDTLPPLSLSDQQIAQEQVLEILPMVSEVNAISEEVDKHRSFEVVLISGAAQEGHAAGSASCSTK